MVLVTLGTQSQNFYRLLESIDKAKIDDEIIVQAGGSSGYKSKKMKILKFVDYKEMDKLIKECDYIITHGGTGSIITPLEMGKKIIACPRLSKYHEHINDHQTEIVNNFSESGYILAFNDGDNLDDIIKKISSFKPKKFKSNTEHFIDCIKEEIDN